MKLPSINDKQEQNLNKTEDDFKLILEENEKLKLLLKEKEDQISKLCKRNNTLSKQMEHIEVYIYSIIEN